MSADTFASPPPGERSRTAANETNERTNAEATAFATNLRGVLLGVFVANAAVQFAIQAWMAWRFGAEVWRLPSQLSIGVPVALDVFVINLMVVAYLLRSARFRTRVYVWVALSVGIAAQLGAAEAFADHMEWGGPARAASLVPAAFLALSLHTLIIVAQHSDRLANGGRRATWTEIRRARSLVKALRKSGPADPVIPPPVIRPHLQAQIVGVAQPAPAPASTPAPAPAPAPAPDPAPPVTRPVRQTSGIASRQRAKGRQASPHRDLAVKRVLAGEPPASVARSLGVSTRAVQGWVKRARDHSPSITDARAIARGENAGADAPLPKGVK